MQWFCDGYTDYHFCLTILVLCSCVPFLWEWAIPLSCWSYLVFHWGDEWCNNHLQRALKRQILVIKCLYICLTFYLFNQRFVHLNYYFNKHTCLSKGLSGFCLSGDKLPTLECTYEECNLSPNSYQYQLETYGNIF